MSALEAFIVRQAGALRSRAEVLKRYGAFEGATSLERAAEDLEIAFREWWLEDLTIADAAAEAGYSEERMRELVRDGRAEGEGTRGRPLRVRRCDLPRKPRAAPEKSLRKIADRLGIR